MITAILLGLIVVLVFIFGVFWTHRTTRDEVIEECAILCQVFQAHYSQLGYSENERTAWTLAEQIRQMKSGGKRSLWIAKL